MSILDSLNIGDKYQFGNTIVSFEGFIQDKRKILLKPTSNDHGFYLYKKRDFRKNHEKKPGHYSVHRWTFLFCYEKVEEL